MEENRKTIFMFTSQCINVGIQNGRQCTSSLVVIVRNFLFQNRHKETLSVTNVNVKFCGERFFLT
jgi:hypothetical protein